MPSSERTFAPVVQTIIAEFIPICHQLAGDQRYAIAVGGSLGKGTWDARSDIDFRLYTDAQLPWVDVEPERWKAYTAAIEAWKEKGIFIDGVWCRTVGEIDAALDGWVAGKIEPVDLVWTIWGYHVLPDMYHQSIIEDSFGIIAGWKERLKTYPMALKRSILKKYTESLRYWRGDYHYANKVDRADVVFLAGMTAKLVHEILQILFALNEVYYVGDGSNLRFAERFHILPRDFANRVQAILYPPQPDPLASQYSALCELIDEILQMTNEREY